MNLVTLCVLLSLFAGARLQAAVPGVTGDTAIFAGGCFWCMEAPFLALSGAKQVDVGYTGGHAANPTYEEVSSGMSGHYEAVRIIYDPAKVPYEKLLETFWRNIDPTDAGGQFVDRGSQYHTAIFYLNNVQRVAAEKSKEDLEKSGKFKKKIATKVAIASPFYMAEEYHQEYFKKQPSRYEMYQIGSGRDNFIRKNWGDEKTMTALSQIQIPYTKPPEPELRKKLSQLEYAVTQERATEPAFNNKYWDNHAEGLYVDIVNGEPLFSSRDKFESGSGWPCFTKPVMDDNITTAMDRTHGMVRTEVRSKTGDSHLGHLFNDGPGPTGARYCINSASLRFIPRKDLAREGYGEFEKVFEQ